ncbi:DUF7402 domain-containing protein [Cohnella rhizosphaerae]|uniref:DUF7402 domain-containing protein n=1 Tax=Cohnella rhizosphaerae TaxID=1457232 RepID=A0A9X4KUH0_9BACL|nr:hypothetical protein [Cohnella rhizosphaerae]MDG0810466.1 hypothetical protein [Cohnella rhizosphaerae]
MRGAATNSNGEHVAWVVNDGTSPIEIDMNLTGLGTLSSVKANIFEASASNNARSPLTTVPLAVNGGNALLHLAAPAKSVVGVLLTPYTISNTTNLAAAATATVSSASGGTTASLLNDGIVGIKDWASNAEMTPWTQLTWASGQTIGKVVLYDRSNLTDRINGGTLIFSDGSSVNVPALPNDGTGKAIQFSKRTVTWVKFQVTDGAGANVGLSEFQVYRGSNIAPAAMLTASSQLNTAAAAHSKATDNVIGAATGEWSSAEVNPWLQLNWLNNQTINEVVLYDRADTSVNANGGILTFSDGSSISVSGIPADGAAKAVSFADKSVSWVKFQTSGGAGVHVGLSEIQVFQAVNAASSAVVTVSSQASDPGNAATMATDGVINQWYKGEWASDGQQSPWIQLNWPSSQRINKVVLYDRPNMIDSANGGTLTFSDGSSIAVSGIDNSGLGKVVSFPFKLVNWVRFQASGSGPNVGLAEIEAFGKEASGGRVFEAEGAEAAHRIGRADGNGWSASWTLDNADHMVYGPYWNNVAAGSHYAVFRMMTDNNTANDDSVARIEVYDATTSAMLAQKTLTRKQFISTFTYLDFPLPFSSVAGHELEFRVYWLNVAYINVDKITLDPS